MRASADGIAILSHDADLTRLLGRADRIDSLTFAQLSRLDLGGAQGCLSLEDALASFGDLRFNIDLKSDDAVAPTVAAILAAGATDRVLVTSFNDRRRRRAIHDLPGVATSASAVTFALALIATQLGSVRIARRVLRHINAVQIPQEFWGMRIATPRIVRLLRQSGVEVHIWTVNDPKDMRRLIDMGVDGLITDRVDLALQVLRNRASTRE